MNSVIDGEKIFKSLRMHYYRQKSLILRMMKKLIPLTMTPVLTMTKHAVLLSDVLSLNVWDTRQNYESVLGFHTNGWNDRTIL